MTATTLIRRTPPRRIGVTGPKKTTARRHLRRGLGITLLLTTTALIASVSAYALANAFV